MADEVYNSIQATLLETAAVQQGDVLIWAVFKSPSDYPDKYAARPHSTRNNRHFDVVLLGNDIDELHKQLPRGLVRIARMPGDDPNIVEVWF